MKLKPSQELDRIMLMLKAVPDDTIIGISIKTAFKQNDHPIDIIAWLKSQLHDSKNVMVACIGNELANDILKFLP